MQNHLNEIPQNVLPQIQQQWNMSVIYPNYMLLDIQYPPALDFQIKPNRQFERFGIYSGRIIILMEHFKLLFGPTEVSAK